MANNAVTVYVCVYCRTPIDDGYMYGAGDGTGQRFAHPLCWVKQENKRLTAEVERLTRERDRAYESGLGYARAVRQILDMAYRRAHKQIIDYARAVLGGVADDPAEAERDALTAQVAVLREAGAVLAEYVEHQPFSLARMTAIEAWRAALAAAGAENGEGIS